MRQVQRRLRENKEVWAEQVREGQTDRQTSPSPLHPHLGHATNQSKPTSRFFGLVFVVVLLTHVFCVAKRKECMWSLLSKIFIKASVEHQEAGGHIF